MSNRIQELAEQAGMTWSHPYDFWAAYNEDLERFAELVRQDEREACAKLCEDLEDETVDTCVGWQYAEVIRGRSE
jgi:hypothetical protein